MNKISYGEEGTAIRYRYKISYWEEGTAIRYRYFIYFLKDIADIWSY